MCIFVGVTLAFCLSVLLLLTVFNSCRGTVDHKMSAMGVKNKRDAHHLPAAYRQCPIEGCVKKTKAFKGQPWTFDTRGEMAMHLRMHQSHATAIPASYVSAAGFHRCSSNGCIIARANTAHRCVQKEKDSESGSSGDDDDTAASTCSDADGSVHEDSTGDSDRSDSSRSDDGERSSDAHSSDSDGSVGFRRGRGRGRSKAPPQPIGKAGWVPMRCPIQGCKGRNGRHTSNT